MSNFLNGHPPSQLHRYGVVSRQSFSGGGWPLKFFDILQKYRKLLNKHWGEVRLCFSLLHEVQVTSC